MLDFYRAVGLRANADAPQERIEYVSRKDNGYGAHAPSYPQKLPIDPQVGKYSIEIWICGEKWITVGITR